VRPGRLQGRIIFFRVVVGVITGGQSSEQVACNLQPTVILLVLVLLLLLLVVVVAAAAAAVVVVVVVVVEQ